MSKDKREPTKDKGKQEPIKNIPNRDDDRYRDFTLPLPPDTPTGPQDKHDKPEPTQPETPPADNPPADTPPPKEPEKE